MERLAFWLISRIFPGFSFLLITFSELWVTRIFNNSGATRGDLIYQRGRIKNHFKYLSWSFFPKIFNDFSLLPVNIHILCVFHWQFLINCTFSVSLKFRACLHHGSVRAIHSEECYILFIYTFLAFFCSFSWRHLCFYHFHFFFWWSIKFMQQNTNQLETEICDKKLSVELYVSYTLKTQENLCFSGVLRLYEMGISVRNELKGFGRVRHINLPHKHKSYSIFWKLFYHISSFLNSKSVLIHLNWNLSSEWVP